MASGGGIDLEDLKGGGAAIGKRMLHPRGDEDHIVLANDIGLVLDDEATLAALDDIDVVRAVVVVELAGGASRREAIEVDVELLGPKAGIDQLDLLAAPALHRARRTISQVENPEHALFAPSNPRCLCNIFDRNRLAGWLQARGWTVGGEIASAWAPHARPYSQS